MSTQLLNYNLIKTTKNTKIIPLSFSFKKKHPFCLQSRHFYIGLFSRSVQSIGIFLGNPTMISLYFFLPTTLTMIYFFYFLTVNSMWIHPGHGTTYDKRFSLIYSLNIWEQLSVLLLFLIFRFGRVLLFSFRRLTKALAWTSQSHSHLYFFIYTFSIFYDRTSSFSMLFLWRPGRVLYEVLLLRTICTFICRYYVSSIPIIRWRISHSY